MVDWVNNFREKLINTKHFEGAFINFLNDKIPSRDYYNGKTNYTKLLTYKGLMDPKNMINSSPLSKDFQRILDAKKL